MQKAAPRTATSGYVRSASNVVRSTECAVRRAKPVSGNCRAALAKSPPPTHLGQMDRRRSLGDSDGSVDGQKVPFLRRPYACRNHDAREVFGALDNKHQGRMLDGSALRIALSASRNLRTSTSLLAASGASCEVRLREIAILLRYSYLVRGALVRRTSFPVPSSLDEALRIERETSRFLRRLGSLTRVCLSSANFGRSALRCSMAIVG